MIPRSTTQMPKLQSINNYFARNKPFGHVTFYRLETMGIMMACLKTLYLGMIIVHQLRIWNLRSRFKLDRLGSSGPVLLHSPLPRVPVPLRDNGLDKPPCEKYDETGAALYSF